MATAGTRVAPSKPWGLSPIRPPAPGRWNRGRARLRPVPVLHLGPRKPVPRLACSALQAGHRPGELRAVDVEAESAHQMGT